MNIWNIIGLIEHMIESKWRITKDFYDKKRQEYRAKQDEIKSKMDNLQNTDEEYYITASYILSLANRAYDLFLNSEPEIKRQLLKLLLQNCEIDNGSLRYTLNYPFSAIFSYTKNHNWLPLYDVFRNLKKELEIDLNTLKHFFESSKITSLCHNNS